MSGKSLVLRLPTVAGQVRGFRRLHRRLSARGDTEHEQALVRLAIVGLLVVYALTGPMPPPPTAWWAPSPLQLAIGVWLVALAHFAWIVVDPAVREGRRSASMLFDHATTVLGMAIGGAATALLYPLLLWITLGHGFRYGRYHLVGSAAISLVLFTLLVVFHPYWRGLGLFNVGLILALILIPGYCLRLLGHLHEARRRAEASSEAKSRFLATMSHELRTPLHAVLGMADLLRGSQLTPEQRDMARTIHTSGHTLLNMIEDILDLARIEAGAEPLTRETVDVHRLLQEVRDMLAHRAHGKGLAFRLRLDAALPARIEAPRRAILQVLVNLATNALKFTDEGEVRLDAQLTAIRGTHATLRLVVLDTGCGIPAAAQKRVFESFAQADETTTRRHGGSGLGLAIVKRLVDGAGGELRLESEVGRGSRFEVDLPVTLHADDVTPPSGRLMVHGTPTARQQHLLEALGTPFQPAGEAPPAFVAGDVADLWCRVATDDTRPPRAGRDLIVWGDGTGVEEALVVLSADADLDALRRAVRAALVFATEKEDTVEPARRIDGSERSLDVLVADDHRVNRQVIERLLAQGGHRAILADCGETALAKLAETAADVVVLDLNMPRLGGLDVARRLVERPDRPRLVALTADATAATRAACEAAGFDAFLTKPVDGSRLLAAVETGIPPRAAAPSAPTQASIDHRRLDLLRQLDQGDGFLDGIIAGFIEDGRGLVDEIESAAAAGDPARFRDAAHAMRSAATHLGATALFERCLAVKSLDADALSRQAPELGRELRAAFEQAARELDHVRTRAAPDAKPTLTPPSASSGSAPSAPSSGDPAAPTPEPVRSRAP